MSQRCSITKKLATVWPLMLFWLPLSVLAAPAVYKWTDENGQVHFSSTPPPENMKKAEQVAVRESYQPDAPASSGWSQKSAATNEAGEQTSGAAAQCRKAMDNMESVMAGAQRDIEFAKETGRGQSLDLDTVINDLKKARAQLSSVSVQDCILGYENSTKSKQETDCLARIEGLRQMSACLGKG